MPDSLDKVHTVSQEIRSIRPLDLRNNIVRLVDDVLRGQEFVVVRKKREVARLSRYTETSEGLSERTISTRDLSRKLGEIINQVRDGVRFIITRSEDKVAVLDPPPVRQSSELSEEQVEKLMLIEDLTVDEVRKAVAIVRGKITIRDLIKGNFEPNKE